MDWSIVLEVIASIVMLGLIVICVWGGFLLEKDKHEAWKARKAEWNKNHENTTKS